MSGVPDAAVDEAERLTRLAMEARDEDEAMAYRRERDRLLAEHGYAARVREGDRGDVLVVYPTEWLVDGTVQPDRIDDLDRAAERRLSGPGDEDDWRSVDAHNREIVSAVGAEAGPVHEANAAAFADFMGNHYVKPVESATPAEIREFLDEYFPRNAWPSDDQRAVVAESVRIVFEVAGRRPPPVLEES